MKYMIHTMRNASFWIHSSVFLSACAEQGSSTDELHHVDNSIVITVKKIEDGILDIVLKAGWLAGRLAAGWLAANKIRATEYKQ